MSFDVKLFILLFMSLGFDWMVQTDWEASNKMKHWYPRWVHCQLYSLLTGILLVLFGYSVNSAAAVSIILFITHFIIDKRTIVTWWMKNIKRIKDPKNPQLWWLNIGIDQWFHLWVNFILCVVIGRLS